MANKITIQMNEWINQSKVINLVECCVQVFVPFAILNIKNNYELKIGSVISYTFNKISFKRR